MIGERSALRRARAARRAGARLRTLAATTAVLGALVVAGVAGAGGTYALLSARTDAGGATVTAGGYDLQINGAASATLGTVTLTPATAQAIAFTVRSVGEVPSTLTASITAAPGQSLAAYTQARLTPLAAGQACVRGRAGALAPLAGYRRAGDALPAGGAITYCLELQLRADTPTALSGQGASFTLVIDGAQEAHR